MCATRATTTAPTTKTTLNGKRVQSKRGDTETKERNRFSFFAVVVVVLICLFVCSLVYLCAQCLLCLNLFFLSTISRIEILFGIFSDIAMHTGSQYIKSGCRIVPVIDIVCLLENHFIETGNEFKSK